MCADFGHYLRSTTYLVQRTFHLEITPEGSAPHEVKIVLQIKNVLNPSQGRRKSLGTRVWSPRLAPVLPNRIACLVTCYVYITILCSKRKTINLSSATCNRVLE